MPRSQQTKAETTPINVELDKSYAYRLGLLHVELRKKRKDVVAEALDDLFAKYERQGILRPNAADVAARILKGEKP